MTECFPIFKGAIYNATIATNTPFFASDLVPTHTPTTFRVYFHSSSSSQAPRVQRTNGSNTMIENFVGTFGLNVPTYFDFLVAPGDTINLIMPTGFSACNIATLIVVEVSTAEGTRI